MTFSDVKRTLVYRGRINHAVVVSLMQGGTVPNRQRFTLCSVDFVCQISFSLTSSILSPKQTLGITLSRLLTPARAISGVMIILLSMHSVITINLERFADYYGGIHMCLWATYKRTSQLLHYECHHGKAVCTVEIFLDILGHPYLSP